MFLKDYLDTTAGDIVKTTGEKIGRHDGLIHYTIGQGVKLANSRVKFYVCDKVKAANQIVVCEACDPQLFRSSFFVSTVNCWNV